MDILIVEDSRFNAFCLKELILQAIYPEPSVSLAHDSASAITLLNQQSYSFLILDGDLGASSPEGNGPALAAKIFSNDEYKCAIIPWTNSNILQRAFKHVFEQYQKPFLCWPKIVDAIFISQSLQPLMKPQWHSAYFATTL